MAVCEVCFRHCEIEEGKRGFCGARICENGKVRALNYGKLTSLALDPVEKKPLKRFESGSLVLSCGSFGCNLRCPFCQNHEISWSASALKLSESTRYVTPKQLAETALYYRDQGNIGIAYTYNEPLIGYEFVRDTAKLVHEAGMKNILVTNGTAELSVLKELAPYIDAMNIDLKGFTDRYYEQVLKGNRQMVMRFIEEAVRNCHVELTVLIVPGENDSDEEMRELSSWVSQLKDAEGNVIGESIPLHISRFFPRFHMNDRQPTRVSTIYRLKEIAEEKLKYVYTGNC